MKPGSRRLKYILPIVAGCILAIWLVVRLTGVLQFYRARSSSGFPTFSPDDWIFATRLGEPRRFGYACFTQQVPGQKSSVMAFRVCGLPGDRIEIRGGVLSVNGHVADNELNVADMYVLGQSDLQKLKSFTDVLEIPYGDISPDSVFVSAPRKAMAKHQIRATRVVTDPLVPDETIAAIFHSPWNVDHFGPITVPAGKYFMLGDNRRNAFDSRFSGFVDRDQIVGFVIGKD